MLERAVEAYRRTVELYPNNAPYRADLAEALRAAGDEAGFRAQKAETLRLERRRGELARLETEMATR